MMTRHTIIFSLILLLTTSFGVQQKDELYLNYVATIKNQSTFQYHLVLKVKNLNIGLTREYCTEDKMQTRLTLHKAWHNLFKKLSTGSSLKRSKNIETWDHTLIGLGSPWDEAIKIRIQEADIILLLISPDFNNSDYIWNIELKKAIERHDEQECNLSEIAAMKI